MEFEQALSALKQTVIDNQSVQSEYLKSEEIIARIISEGKKS